MDAVGDVDGTGLRTLGDQVYEALVNSIVTGVLPPGARITEVELARQYSVSRGPLREAIRRLEERRLVTREPHVGARVVALSQEVLLEIFQVREALEGMAARLAAERMSDVQLAELSAMLASHAEQVEKSEVYHQRHHDWDFHYRIAQGARNSMISTLLCGDLYQLLRLYRYQHKSTPKRARAALQEHRRIVDALTDRDGELAELLMRRHISTARRGLEVSISKAEAS